MLDDLRVELTEQAADLHALREFARVLLEQTYEGLSLCGVDVQELAEQHGLIVEVPGGYDPEQHPSSDCDPGDTYYESTRRLLGRSRVPGGGRG